ncbi:MAG: Gfo/Idh/MocA family oxidoreductase, partial [Proteobacteria bacterium]|nr:Gfo/Idh/MocA family oxidoreductase [Pseudomonadota bacterium]
MGNILITHFASSRAVEVEVEIYGETGALIYRLSDPNHIKLAIGQFVKENQMIDAPIPERFKLPQDQIWRRNVHAFVDALANDTDMNPNFSDGLRNQEIQQAAVISTEEKRWVEFPIDG